MRDSNSNRWSINWFPRHNITLAIILATGNIVEAYLTPDQGRAEGFTIRAMWQCRVKGAFNVTCLVLVCNTTWGWFENPLKVIFLHTSSCCVSAYFLNSRFYRIPKGAIVFCAFTLVYRVHLHLILYYELEYTKTIINRKFNFHKCQKCHKMV